MPVVARAPPLTAALRERGAAVTGIDSSAAMLSLARQRLGENASLELVDLRDPLPFVDETFDDVVSSLVLHYLQDWGDQRWVSCDECSSPAAG